MRSQSRYLSFLLLIGVVIYYFTYCTPLYSDDWNYTKVFHIQRPITSLWDVFVSQYYHYLYQNGRTVPHLILQTFDGLLGKGVFNIFNALAFILLLILISKRQKRSDIAPVKTACIAFTLLFFLINGFKESFLWMSGSCNYLWVADLLLIFDLLIRRDGYRSKSLPGLFLFGLICGWTHEGIVIGVSAGYFVYYLFHKSQLNKARISALAGLYLGTLLVIASPGSLRRLHISGNHLDYASNHLEALYYMGDMRALPVLLILLTVLVILRRIQLKAFIMEHLMELVAIATTFLIILYTACTAHRSRFGFEFYAILLIIDLLLTLDVDTVKKTAYVAAAATFLYIGLLIPKMQENREESEGLVTQLEKTNTGLVVSRWNETGKWADNYILRLRDSNLRNLYIPEYYQLNNVVILPQKFIEDLEYAQVSDTLFKTTPHLPFYFKAHHGKTPRYAKIKLRAADADEIPWTARPIAKHIGAYSLTHFSAISDTLSHRGEHYVIVWKQKAKGIPAIHHLEDRMQEIHLME